MLPKRKNLWDPLSPHFCNNLVFAMREGEGVLVEERGGEISEEEGGFGEGRTGPWGGD